MAFDHFLDAQRPVYNQVCLELREGRKRSHWMWYIFPQLRGLGRSAMAERFAIASRAEAGAYLDHPVLGARLLECTELALQHPGRPLAALLPPPNDLKFRSSMTLFSLAAPGEHAFSAALAMHCDGLPDPETLRLIAQQEPRA